MKRTAPHPFATLMLALPVGLVGACNAPARDSVVESAVPETPSAGAPEAPRPFASGAPAIAEGPAVLSADGWRGRTVAGVSNAGTYRVHYRTKAGAIERGTPFGLEVWVVDPETGRPRADVTLSVDAAMPEHEHGMNREPRVTPAGRSGTGAFEVEGMLFHMLGRWELYLDVTHGAITERTQFEVRLE